MPDFTPRGYEVPLGTDPIASGDDLLRANFAQIDTEITALETALGGGLRVRMAYAVGAPNGSGQLAISFGITFASNPVVMCALGDAASQVKTVDPIFSTISKTGFTCAMYNSAGSVVTSGTYRVVFLAIGAQ